MYTVLSLCKSHDIVLFVSGFNKNSLLCASLQMGALANLSLILTLLSISILSGHAQLCNRTDLLYTNCDYSTPVCECVPSNNVCRFCFEIETRHTFTRYFLTEEGVSGYGGRVVYFNDQGQLKELPPENSSDMPPSCVTRCTDAHTTDGYSFRPIITINNQFPGPTLIVPNNSIVLVDVYNRLSSETTSIHWHGMHQMNTPWMDGVEHITQCGIAPSSSFRYIFRANPPGTHWYHSHSGAQRTDGLFGALIVKEDSPPGGIKPYIDQPEKYTITLIDWQKEDSLDLFAQIHAGIRYFDQDRVPPTPSDYRVPRTCSPDGTDVGTVSYWSGLINGLGRHQNISYEKTKLATFTVQPNSSYRFRLIGAQSLFAYRFSIDEHNLTLIATDGHFIKHLTVDFIIIHSGERYDFLLETKSAPTKNFFIRAETLEVSGSDPSICGNNANQLFPLFDNHTAEAILHYTNVGELPGNNMYQEIADSAKPKSTQCEQSQNCIAVNCPFERFPSSFGISCKHIHELNLLNNANNDLLLDFDTANTLFFNFGFEGDGSTSAINGRNFVFPPAPLSQNDKTNQCNTDSKTQCDKSGRLVSPDCFCTHVYKIEYKKSYRFVFTAVGPNRNDNTNWNFAHPIHLHGHSFHVAKIGFGTYNNSTGRILSASEDITCVDNSYICTNPQWTTNSNDVMGRRDINRAPLKDTIIIPAGGYAVVYFKANNPGYWFLHCHIEVHQLEGMAVVINEAEGMHNAPPPNMPQCGNFTWEPNEFRQKESMPGSTQSADASTCCNTYQILFYILLTFYFISAPFSLVGFFVVMITVNAKYRKIKKRYVRLKRI